MTGSCDEPFTVTERRSMAVLVGSKQLARVQGDNAQGHVTEAMFSLPEGDDHVAADARHTLDTLGLARALRLGREDNAWFSRPPGARGWTGLKSSGRSCGTMVGSS